MKRPVVYRRQEVDEHKWPLLDFGDGLVDGLSDVVDILAGQAAHVDAAASHQVHVLLFDHVLHLFGCSTNCNRVSELHKWCEDKVSQDRLFQTEYELRGCTEAKYKTYKDTLTVKSRVQEQKYQV